MMFIQERKIGSFWTSFMDEPFIKFDDLLPLHKIKGGRRPDIVVMTLQEPFNLNQFVKPACLPVQPIDAGSTCYVSGWGHTKPIIDLSAPNLTLHTSDKLLASRLTILSTEECEKSYHDFIYQNCINKTDSEISDQICKALMQRPFLKKYEICTESGNQDSCKGDSGGPLICQGNQYQMYFPNPVIERNIKYTK